MFSPFLFYPNSCPTCKTQIAFSCLVMVIVWYLVTGSVRCPQDKSLEYLYQRKCHLLALCFAKAIPSQRGRIMKCRLKIAGRSHIAEKSLENSSCVCTQALIQLNPRQSHANYHNRNVLFRWCHCCLSNSSLDLFWNLRVRFEECLISLSVALSLRLLLEAHEGICSSVTRASSVVPC